MKHILLTLFIGLLSARGYSQAININSLLTPNELVNNFLAGLGVSVSNVTVNGSPLNANIPISNLTYFSNSNPAFPFNAGVLLTTGNAFAAVGPNDGSADYSNVPPTSDVSSDPHLLAIANGTLFNGVVLEFDFITSGDTLIFNYVFGSEEYPEFSPGNYNDAFGLFLWGPGISGQYPLGGFASGGVNLAVLPDGTPVTINNVGDATNTQYYVANDNGLAYGSAIQYDGTTVVLTAGAGVQCGQLYHMKLAIANVGDETWDSGLFLQAGSLSSPTYQNTSASIFYNSPFCLPSVNQPVILNGTGAYTGGTFSSQPGGLTIDSLTGEINPNASVVGEYQVIYNSPPLASACFASTSTNVKILNDAVLPIPEICGVGLDSLTQKNRIVWEKPSFIGIDSFFVFRETTPNSYAQIGTVNYYNPAIYVDMNSNPMDTFYRYKISIKGYCGAETAMSTVAHETVQLSVSPGAGGVFNLSWNPYIGFPYSSYNLYRGSDPSNIVQIATLPNTATTYQDNTPPAGALFYQIEVVNPNDCDPTKINGYGVSRSNIASNGIATLSDGELPGVTVYPNPTNGDVTIEVKEGLIGKNFKIVDAVGRTIISDRIDTTKQILELGGLHYGTYLMFIESNNKAIKLVKE